MWPSLPGLVRGLVMRVPESLQPQSARTVAVVAVDNAGEVVHAYSGDIDGFSMLTASANATVCRTSPAWRRAESPPCRSLQVRNSIVAFR